MAEKPNGNPEDFETQSNFPDSNDPTLNIKIAGMVRLLGIEQSPQEFVDDLEGDLVASVNKAARIGAKQKISKKITTSVNDEDDIPSLNKYPIEEQEKIVAKKLKLYRKTQENIKKEITRLLAISSNKELSPANANKINRLISNMRSLDARMALYTKKDEAFRKQRQQQEQTMLQQNKKKKLQEKIKKQKKQIKEAEAAQDKEGISSFLLPGKWLEIYKRNEQNRINEMKSNLSKDQETLKKLEKSTAPEITKKQPQKPFATKVHKVVAVTPTPRDADIETAEATKPLPLESVPAQPTKQIRPPQETAPQHSPPSTAPTTKPSSPSANPTLKPLVPAKAKTQKPLFPELFGKPEVKGKPAPDPLSGDVMKKVEQKRDQKFVDSQQAIRRQEAQPDTKKNKN